MDKQIKIIGLIPARGGSKTLPRKNVLLLNGKPLIWHTINEARKSKYLQRVIVSTEDGEIAEIARQYGAEVMERPVELARDDTPARLVCQHAISHLEEKENYLADAIVMLQPTSPCRLAGDIDRAIELFLETDCDSVVSVCEAEHSPYWTFNIENDRLKPLFKDWNKVAQRQDAPGTYRLNGAVYIIHRSVIMEHHEGLMGSNIRPYVMPAERSVDIDTIIDLKLAELLMKENE